MKRFRDYPLSKVASWLDTLPKKRPPSRRSWKKFTDWAMDEFGDFAESTGDGGYSGAPKLLAACHVIGAFRESGDAPPKTVGEALDAAKSKGLGLGWLPPVEHAIKIAKTAGRADLFSGTRFARCDWR